MDDTAQAALIAAFIEQRDALRRALAARVGVEQAEELVQDLYLRLRQTAPNEPILNARAYLYRLAFNLMIDQQRTRQRSARRDDRWSRDHSVLRGGDDRAPEPAADDRLVARQALNRVLAALDTLPPQTQRAFRLHKLEGLSYREVAAAMGVSVSAVEKHLSRALKRLVQEVDR